MDNLISHLEQISADTERCSAFCLAYVALVRYLTFCDGMPSDADVAQQEECKNLFLTNENLSAETRASLELLFADEKPIYFKTRKYLDAVSTDDLTVLKDFAERLYTDEENITEQERITWDKFISYYDERTDKWHWERSTEKWNEDMEALSNFTYAGESHSQSGLKKALMFSAMIVGGVVLVGMGIALGKEVMSETAKFIPINEMSDKELLRRLTIALGPNTGETVASRARLIIEANKRGLPIPKLYKL